MVGALVEVQAAVITTQINEVEMSIKYIYKSWIRAMKRCAYTLIACGTLSISSVYAQISQTPLLTQSGSVEPNLVFVFDDSGSMAWNYMYQYDPEDVDGDSDYYDYSPDINLIYYDPRIKYLPRINSDGTNQTYSTASDSSFKVYFYTPGSSSSTKYVSTVSINTSHKDNKNFPSNVSVVFSKSDTSGGVTATGTASVSNGKITSLTVTNGGTGYTNTPTIKLNYVSGGKNKSTTCKFCTVTLTNSSSSSNANRKWLGTTDLNSGNFFSTGSGTKGYLPDAGSPLASGANATVIYPNTASSSVTQYPKFQERTDCTGTVCTWAEERNNYSIWKAFYSNRVQLARTGIGRAFQSLGPTLRLGWARINGLESSGQLDAGVSLFTSARKSAFYTWLYGSDTNPSGDTPNRLAIDKVGSYFSRQDANGPWGTNPLYTSTSSSSSTTGGTESISNFASCRRSNVMLMTDGYWNGASANLSNIDGTDGPTISGPSGSTYKYTSSNPYKDTTSNTLADVAMKYWNSDLQPNIANRVAPVPGINESFWQNVSFYGIGLGVYGTLEPSQDNLNKITNGDILWPVAASNSPTAIDDMWHAAVNTRGQFLSAGNSAELTSALEKMMVTINRISSSQSGVAVSTANLINGTRKYTPQYTTGSWSGNVIARNLNADTANEVSTAWQVESVDAVTGEAESTIPIASARNIVVGTGAAVGATTRAVPFTYSGVTAAGLTTAMGGGVTSALIDYLRGDATNEGTLGAYRTRETRLGDIVNSTPIFVKQGIEFRYDNLPTAKYSSAAASYRSFVTSQAANNDEGVLFVGANDGMLHAFRDGTASTTDNAGSEVFAYVPYAVLPNIGSLASKSYTHQYFVDGPLTETSLYNGSAWSNVLLGSTGAGAKTIFALNVTDPLNMNSGSVMWEITPSRTGFGNLGHVLTDVQAGPLPSGDWVAIFGNGYFSTAGKASLYVVNLATGALLKELVVDTGSGNGLGGVRLVRDDKQQVIGAYAGDLKGKLWKFDLSGADSAAWTIGLSGSALLDLGTTKPMTAAPAVVKHPNGGYVVSVGTGKFFESSDTSTTSQQGIYGVWDSVLFASQTTNNIVPATPSGVVQSGITNLVQQTITTNSTVTRNYVTSDLTAATESLTYFEVSRNTIDWSSKRGWYINLPNTGERVVYPISVLQGRYLAVDAISPSNVSSNSCTSAGQGSGYVYLIDGMTGSGPNETILDTNGNGTVDSSDALVSGFTARADGRNTWLNVGTKSSSTATVFAGITGGDASGITVKLSCQLLGNCATPGVNGLKSRNWRQIYMRK